MTEANQITAYQRYVFNPDFIERDYISPVLSHALAGTELMGTHDIANSCHAVCRLQVLI